MAVQISVRHNLYVCLFFDDRLYSAILRSLEQTHYARLWFYVSDKLFIARFLNIHRSGVSTYGAGMAGAT